MKYFALLLTVLSLGCSSAFGQKVLEIQVKTSTVNDAEMDGDGGLSIGLLNINFEECQTGRLDDVQYDNFEKGLDQ